MRWFASGISRAIEVAKAKDSIFVVYCAGKDENTEIFNKYINTDEVSSRLKSDSFVAVKIESDQQEYMQFCKIYQIVPVPSLFFIKNGVPIKVVTSVVKSADEIVEAIDNLLKTNSGPTSSEQKSAEQALEAKIAENLDKPTADPDIVCEGGVCYKKEQPATSQEEPATSKEESEQEKQEKIRKAMKLIEEKRIEKIKEEQRLEKESEIRRRKEGQEVQKLKKWQDDQELQQLKDGRKKERIEAMEARRRVLEQIEEDKKERARRFNMTSEPESVPKAKQEVPQVTPTTSSDSAKIQFKKPDGETEVVTFYVSMLFGDLHAFVKSDILQGYNYKDFTLATTFPRREFTSDDFGKTLLDLQLAPSSVLLIIPGKKATSNQNKSSVQSTSTDGGFFSMMSALFMGLMSPMFAVVAYLKSFVFRNQGEKNSSDNDAGKRKRDEESLMPNDAAKRRNMSAFNQASVPSTSDAQTGAIPKSSTYKRVNPTSNIHRLHQDSDSEDERKTYNGNSTQQM